MEFTKVSAPSWDSADPTRCAASTQVLRGERHTGGLGGSGRGISWGFKKGHMPGRVEAELIRNDG